MTSMPVQPGCDGVLVADEFDEIPDSPLGHEVRQALAVISPREADQPAGDVHARVPGDGHGFDDEVLSLPRLEVTDDRDARREPALVFPDGMDIAPESARRSSGSRSCRGAMRLAWTNSFRSAVLSTQ